MSVCSRQHPLEYVEAVDICRKQIFVREKCSANSAGNSDVLSHSVHRDSIAGTRDTGARLPGVNRQTELWRALLQRIDNYDTLGSEGFNKNIQAYK